MRKSPIRCGQDVQRERYMHPEIFVESYCINISKGFRKGDSIKIISGSLTGYESKIIRINRNRRIAVVALDILGKIVETSIGLEIIGKI